MGKGEVPIASRPGTSARWWGTSLGGRMAFYGADVQQLKQLSKSLSAGAAQLSGKARELDSLIGRSQSSWQGQDAKKFAAEWQGRLRPLLVDTSQDLEEAAKKVLQNAAEQSSASTDGLADTTTVGID